MQKTILITGSTDGIGLETARMLLSKGHKILLHGRSEEKLNNVENELSKFGKVESYLADLSDLNEVKRLAEQVAKDHQKIDILINNAGILKTSNPLTKDGLDIRFVVNTIAPYLLTKFLLPIIDQNGRVINLSSAAQSEVDLEALKGNVKISSDMEAYAQSKLAITIWSYYMAKELGDKEPIVISVNPGSLLASKMVKEGFGIAGNDLSIGADILTRLSLDDEFKTASGKYYDNDSKRLIEPDFDLGECKEIIYSINKIIEG